MLFIEVCSRQCCDCQACGNHMSKVLWPIERQMLLGHGFEIKPRSRPQICRHDHRCIFWLCAGADVELQIGLQNCFPDKESLTAMASFHLIIKIPPCCASPRSFNYRIAACSKHAARFLSVQETVHFHIPRVSLIPLIDFLGNSVLILSSYFNASLVCFLLFLWALRTLAFFLDQLGHPIRIHVWSFFFCHSEDSPWSRPEPKYP